MLRRAIQRTRFFSLMPRHLKPALKITAATAGTFLSYAVIKKNLDNKQKLRDENALAEAKTRLEWQQRDIDHSTPDVLKQVMNDLGFENNSVEAAKAIYLLRITSIGTGFIFSIRNKFTKAEALTALKEELDMLDSCNDPPAYNPFDDEDPIGGFLHNMEPIGNLKQRQETLTKIASVFNIKLDESLEKFEDNVNKIISTLKKVINEKYPELLEKYSSKKIIKSDLAAKSLSPHQQLALTDEGLEKLFNDASLQAKRLMTEFGFETETQQKGFTLFLELTRRPLSEGDSIPPYKTKDQFMIRELTGDHLDRPLDNGISANYRAKFSLSTTTHKNALFKAINMMGLSRPDWHELQRIRIPKKISELSDEEQDCYALIMHTQRRVNRKYSDIQEKLKNQSRVSIKP